MLVVTIDLYSARTGGVTRLGQMIIANVGGTAERGNYTAKVANKRDADNIRATWARPQRTGEVSDYPRLSYNVWRLVSRALRSAFPEEK